MNIHFQSTVLFVKDIAVSRRFYQELLGQTVLVDHGPNVGFAGGFAIWQAEHALQTIYARLEDDPQPLGRRNCEIYFESDELDPLCTRLQAEGIELIHPIHEQPWGQRVVRFYDPDHHIVEVGEPMPFVIQRFLAQGLSVEQVAQRTFMPPEIVQQLASLS